MQSPARWGRSPNRKDPQPVVVLTEGFSYPIKNRLGYSVEQGGKGLRWWGLPGGTPSEISSQTRSVSVSLTSKASADPRATGAFASTALVTCEVGKFRMPLFPCLNIWEIVAIVELLNRRASARSKTSMTLSPSSAVRIPALNLAARNADRDMQIMVQSLGLAGSYKEERSWQGRGSSMGRLSLY